MSEPAIQIDGLAKRFGRERVLDALSLRVEQGQTFGFLGVNGAGKTTTIRALLGLLKPDAGQVRVLGMDPLRESMAVRRRVGYLAEDQRMFGWMTVRQIMSFIAPFYPTWNDALAKRLADQFELPVRTRVKHLSKGQNVRLGLLLALAHEPELVILDDPTLGLDPIMRKQVLRDVVSHLQGAGRTVFFSSHLLYEIEPVADMVAILHHGRIIKQATTEQLRRQVKRFIVPETAAEAVRNLTGLLDAQMGLRQISVVVEDAAKAEAALRSAGVQVQVVDLNLDEIFEAYVIGKRELSDAQQVDLEAVA